MLLLEQNEYTISHQYMARHARFTRPLKWTGKNTNQHPDPSSVCHLTRRSRVSHWCRTLALYMHHSLASIQRLPQSQHTMMTSNDKHHHLCTEEAHTAMASSLDWGAWMQDAA